MGFLTFVERGENVFATHHPEPEVLKEESKRLLLFGKDVLFADGNVYVNG